MRDLIVSVVIPTYARPQQLRCCLDALTRQTMAKHDFELVVVDDGSPEPLDEIVASFVSTLSIRLVRQKNAGPAMARNRGIREAAAALVAFTDDDCRPQPEWLERLVAGERAYPGALIGGSTVNGLVDDIFATTSQLIVDLVYEHFNDDPDNGYFLRATICSAVVTGCSSSLGSTRPFCAPVPRIVSSATAGVPPVSGSSGDRMR